MRALGIVSVVLSVLVGTLHAHPPLNISADLIRMIALPNAVGEYGDTALTDINAQGLSVGGFLFATTHGLQEGSFTLAPDGTVRLFTCGPDVTWTQAVAVNIHPAIVGWCYTRAGETTTIHGFYRSEGGKITALRVPGAVITEPAAVNDRHVVVGFFTDTQGRLHGFRWTRSTGRYDTIDAPFPDAAHTALVGIRNTGAILANVYRADFTSYPALLRQGVWSVVTVPGVVLRLAWQLTERGEILAEATGPDGDGTYLLSAGTAQRLTLPLPATSAAVVTGLSPQGLAVGRFNQEVPLPEGTTCPCPIYGFLTQLRTLLAPASPAGSPVAPRGAWVPRALDEPPALQIQWDGCPDEPVPPGMVRPGKLAMSWVGCRR